MIESAVVKLEKFKNYDYIEKELAKLYSNIVRWSVVDISDSISVSVSYEK